MLVLKDGGGDAGRDEVPRRGRVRRGRPAYLRQRQEVQPSQAPHPRRRVQACQGELLRVRFVLYTRVPLCTTVLYEYTGVETRATMEVF